jgi:hypothetical protein
LSTHSHLVELLRAPLDLELAAVDIGCAFAKRTLQIFDLRESFRALPLVRLSETARESQDLVTIGIFPRLCRCRVPAVRLP